LEQHDITLRSELAVNSAAIAFHHSVSYHCDVLTAGAWPISSTSPESKILLPPEIDAHIALFTKFYTERSTGRKLQWIHHLSYGILQTHFLDKRYEFALSFYQMLILLQVCSGSQSLPTLGRSTASLTQ
jgi:cullin 1